ncbi:MAG: hypothetical protein WCS30_14240, partial [Selenomonadaceae bacterium]
MIRKNEVYSRISTKIKEKYSDAFFTSERVNSPPKFPTVSIVEVDTYPDSRYTTLSLNDTQRQSMFELNTYSNKASGSSIEIDEIMSIAEQAFREIGYVKITQ